MVIAVEPQSRLTDVLEINLSLNSPGRTRIFRNVVGETEGALRQISLFPISNTGATSLVNPYRFGAKSEDVVEITPSEILAQCGVAHADFVKVDVEGFEPEVILGALPLLQEGRIGTLLLDYHRAILERRGIDADVTHRRIVGCGYDVLEGSVGDGYVLYRHQKTHEK